ncbi:hypothetical protein [Gottfriedia luciferensis]|uniref:hypothetical protein n=1 Tax=Gottfriedia luciferensis TaxID=178774 RepID=UPI000B43BC59|nr:hypothetical protein [Gottfriedia luciferensis]
MKNKKIIWLLIIILLLWFAINIYRNHKFSVNIYSNNLSKKIEYNINYFHGRRSELVKVQALRVVTLEDSNIALAFAKYNGLYGRTRLVKGPNGKYQIKGSSWRGRLDPAEVETFKTNKGRYQVIMGNNENKDIDTIELRAFTWKNGVNAYSDYTTILEVPKQDVYFIYKKIPIDHILKNFTGNIEFVCKNKEGKIIYPIK